MNDFTLFFSGYLMQSFFDYFRHIKHQKGLMSNFFSSNWKSFAGISISSFFIFVFMLAIHYTNLREVGIKINNATLP